jgi:hypothetical protein
MFANIIISVSLFLSFNTALDHIHYVTLKWMMYILTCALDKLTIVSCYLYSSPLNRMCYLEKETQLGYTDALINLVTLSLTKIRYCIGAAWSYGQIINVVFVKTNQATYQGHFSAEITFHVNRIALRTFQQQEIIQIYTLWMPRKCVQTIDSKHHPNSPDGSRSLTAYLAKWATITMSEFVLPSGRSTTWSEPQF